MDVLLSIDDLDVDGQVRRPVDNVGVVATGVINSDGVGDIRRDDCGAGVGATDPSDSDSMVDVGQSDYYSLLRQKIRTLELEPGAWTTRTTRSSTGKATATLGLGRRA